MMNLYPNSGKKLKVTVRILNLVGYFFGALCAIAAGAGVGMLLSQLGVHGMLSSLLSVLAAGAVAALMIFIVWFWGLVLWNISDASENSQTICEKMDV